LIHLAAIGRGKPTEAVHELRADVIKKRERCLVDEPVPDLAPCLPPIDDPALVQKTEMARDVLLRSVERVSQSLTDISPSSSRRSIIRIRKAADRPTSWRGSRSRTRLACSRVRSANE